MCVPRQRQASCPHLSLLCLGRSRTSPRTSAKRCWTMPSFPRIISSNLQPWLSKLGRPFTTSRATGVQCILCLMATGRAEPHPHQKCDRLQYACLRCLSKDHRATSCRIKYSYQVSVCFACGLPARLGEVAFHGKDQCVRNCPQKEIPLAVAWTLFRDQRKTLDVFGLNLSMSEADFAMWMCRTAGQGVRDGTEGLTNCVRVFVYCYQRFREGIYA